MCRNEVKVEVKVEPTATRRDEEDMEIEGHLCEWNGAKKTIIMKYDRTR